MSRSQILENPYGARAPMLMGATWTMATIAIILSVLRTYTNVAIIKHFCWDYYWAMLALVTGIIGESFDTIAATSGLGNHFSLLSHQDQVAALKWSYVVHIPVINAIGFGKLAVVAFLLRIQDRGHPKEKWFLYFMGTSGCAVNMIITVLLLLQCEPLERQWNDWVPGSCPHILRTTNAGYFAGSWAAASDVLLALYPVIVYRNLQISRKDKIALFALLGGGVLAGASSVIKTVYIKVFDQATDKTYTITDLVLWELVECWLVLILGSLPPLRALYLRLSRHGSTAHARSRCNMHQNDHARDRFTIHRESLMNPQAKGAHDAHGYGHRYGNSDGSEDLTSSHSVGIVKTTSIRISREERNGDADADADREGGDFGPEVHPGEKLEV